jgi:type I restriction enzyme S subunit
VWANLDALLADFQGGKSFKCDERPPREGEVGVVKVSAVSWGEYDEAASKTCMDTRMVNPDLYVRAGDFLFSRANTIDLVGACVIAKHVSKEVMLSDKILRFRFLSGVEYWVLHFLRSRFGRSEIERLSTGNQESMRNIGQNKIRTIRIPVPPKKESNFILAEVDHCLSIIVGLEATIESNLKRNECLRKSILQNAFSCST